jgi:hypothetical protein
MPTITLPFYFRYEKANGRSDHGWCPVEVDVPVVSDAEMTMVVCEVHYGFGGRHDVRLRSVYFRDGNYYESASAVRENPIGQSMFNVDGVRGELELSSISEQSLKYLTSSISKRTFKAGYLPKQREPTLSGKTVSSSMVSELDIAAFRRWAWETLIISEGRLLVQTVAPSLQLKLWYQYGNNDRALFEKVSTKDVGGGLYYPYPNEDFYGHKKEAVGRRFLSFDAEFEQEGRQIIDAYVTTAGLDDQFVSTAHGAFNVAVLSKLANKSEFAVSGLKNTAVAMANRSYSNHLKSPATLPYRRLEKALKSDFDGFGDSRYDNIARALEELGGLVTNDCEHWLIRNVLDCYYDREIVAESVAAPTRQIDLGKGLAR